MSQKESAAFKRAIAEEAKSRSMSINDLLVDTWAAHGACLRAEEMRHRVSRNAMATVEDDSQYPNMEGVAEVRLPSQPLEDYRAKRNHIIERTIARNA